MKLILASKSPRRIELIKRLNCPLKIIASKIDESTVPTNLPPEQYCTILARMKTEHISKTQCDSIIIGADTIVSIKNQILNKPKKFSEAQNMLKLLSGKTHSVYTGVHIVNFQKFYADRRPAVL